ncbi:hypothetical protein B4064_1171 [Caldibacillus thermoamylovorans]|uniref:Uncharacterized protein n=1 Tax=Caldibacillus thermoamylovorans TaxID=35841 RepID=A0A0D0FWI5_9BACI|nr:hypothetical protein [Caldibacillus thermoamylovorans]MCB5936324.1 hypothetical protein [Bacillus sp. DFI.2.34]AWI12610.1 hypothetical protein CQJ30_10845 [Caldibacillus thermoamylovorans]KIO66476.1 hypothetical protein B4166_2572 [Caldibacillus thermoamylovorans]KIO69596.1 hypothetical protein B4064_1171 [Caldibacillus thermoamylovorans]KIO73799.1 hypothetical protein B4167_1861 [Caldibacillus thermoamylovorans]
MVEKVEERGKLENLINQFQHLHAEYTKIWLDDVFLHLDWWISIIISVGTWIFWFFYRKKESTHRLLYAGAFAMLISVILVI